jgi:hypothetical protein
MKQGFIIFDSLFIKDDFDVRFGLFKIRGYFFVAKVISHYLDRFFAIFYTTFELFEYYFRLFWQEIYLTCK